jgi:hypothetical protein
MDNEDYREKPSVSQASGDFDIVGNNGNPLSKFPLGLCEGDCDNDGECESGLTCFQRDGDEPVPGCTGRAKRGIDYCHSAGGGNELFLAGDNGEPSSVFPLGRCEGDCDNDTQCGPGLLCFQRRGTEAVPGCSGTGVSGKDYCYQPEEDGDLTIEGNNGTPSSAFPLGLCEGDCDNDSQCAAGLRCFQRDGTEPVPGCSGTGVPRKDYCYADDTVDRCPNDPNKTDPGNCGCGVPEGTCGGDDDFSIGFIGDTQNLSTSDRRAALLEDMMEFFVDIKDEINLVFVSSLGDMVEHGSSSSEWRRVEGAYDILEEANIPYAPVCGNHDSCSTMNNYFPVSQFRNTPTWGGRRDGIENAYYEISASRVDLLLLTVEYNAGSGILDWADGVLEQHADRAAIVVTHNLSSSIKTTMRRNDNVFLGVQGHLPKNRAYWTQTSSGGTRQHLYIFDYQSASNADRNARVRWYTFSPQNNEVCTKTYDVANDTYLTDNDCSGGRDNTECNQHCWHFDMN